jgi:phosphate transport system protein
VRNRFGEQLERLHVEMIQMGALCEDAISAAAQALMKGDEDLARAAGEAEREIDQKEREVENLCLKLLLQQQPVASDLRLISSVLKMITDIERIGDQASDIAEIVTYLSGACGHNTHIDQMAQATIKMVTDSLDAFVRRDLTLAWSVIEYDDVVDRLFDECKSDLIAEIAQNPEDGERVLDVLMIAKYLERIGDHATNIAEWVEFSITGSHKSAMHGAEAAAR